MYSDNNLFYNDLRILAITSTTTKTQLSELIRVAVAAKSQDLPSHPILAIEMTPSADITLEDIKTADTITLTSGTTKLFTVLAIDQKLLLKNAATVKLIIYFGH